MPKTFKVHFSRSQRTLEIAEDGIILEQALRNGLNVDYGCQGGSCGSCMVKVKGEVFQWGRAIDDDEKAQGLALICSAYPLGDLEIDA